MTKCPICKQNHIMILNATCGSQKCSDEFIKTHTICSGMYCSRWVLIENLKENFCPDCKKMDDIRKNKLNPNQDKIDNKQYKNICVHCLKPFNATSKKKKYCSDVCKEAQSGFKSIDVLSYNEDVGEGISKSKKDRKKMQQCSVECLLEEFGDID